MQQFINHVRYFVFLSLHFNPLLALCLVRDEVRGEKRYNLQTTGFTQVSRLPLKVYNKLHAHEYMPSNYRLLESLFTKLNTFTHNKTFLDIGCGKGRAMMVAAHFGYKKILGVEMVDSFCRHIQTEIKKFTAAPQAVHFQIHCADASQFSIPDDVQTILFYNPFDENVMNVVLGNILESLGKAKRPLYVVYLCPIYKNKFLNTGFVEIYTTTRFNYLKASIFQFKD